MSSNRHFPHFYFIPKKLQGVANELKKKYRHGAPVSERLMDKKLPDILARIRKLSNNKNEIRKFAGSLTPLEINMLASRYPYENENQNTIDKISIILFERYNDMIGLRFWQHFQRMPTDKGLTHILKDVFTREKPEFLGLKQHIRQEYNRIFQQINSSEILNQIANIIGQEHREIDDSFVDWKIQKDSHLSQKLWLYLLDNYIGNINFIEKQGARRIHEELEKIQLGLYKRILNKYLVEIDYEQYHMEIFNQAISRLGNPKYNKYKWHGISDEAINKVLMKLRELELMEFFDSDSIRFNYWKKYVRYMEDAVYIEDPPIVAMKFTDFIVVEFSRVGNAAYFYKKDGFNRDLEPKLTSGVRESELKNTEDEYFINKLNHSRNWTSRYDEYMANYLQGYFHYHH